MTEPARQRLLDALVTITAERGLDEVSVREVATSAGVSIGTVQYYCGSKDQMLLMTFHDVAERIIGRTRSIGATGGTVGSVLRRSLLELLPLDDLRRRESRVYLAFAARAAVSAELAEVQNTVMSELRAQCAAAFRLASSRAEAVVSFDPDQAAAATAALIDGLLLHLLTNPDGLTPQTALAILDTHLRHYVRIDDALTGADHTGGE